MPWNVLALSQFKIWEKSYIYEYSGIKQPYKYEYFRVKKWHKYRYFRTEKFYRYGGLIVKKLDKNMQGKYSFRIFGDYRQTFLSIRAN